MLTPPFFALNYFAWHRKPGFVVIYIYLYKPD